MDAKLVNPFIDALVSVLPQMGFEVPQRSGMSVKNQTCKRLEYVRGNSEIHCFQDDDGDAGG